MRDRVLLIKHKKGIEIKDAKQKLHKRKKKRIRNRKQT